MPDVKRASKFLSLVLRHQPQVANVTLDAQGWVDIDALIAGSNGRLDRASIDAAVADNDKQRFGVSADGKRIRARQGHSIPVDLSLVPVSPPDFLYHGTNVKAYDTIHIEGLKKMARQHVHMAVEIGTARSVGMRHGSEVVIRIDAGEMHLAGFEFYKSENGVWLTDHVPAQFLQGLEVG